MNEFVCLIEMDSCCAVIHKETRLLLSYRMSAHSTLSIPFLYYCALMYRLWTCTLRYCP